ADRYEGNIIIRQHAALPDQQIPAIINIRDGALGALLVLILGIIFGWLARKVEESEEQIVLLDFVAALMNKISFMTEDRDKLYVSSFLDGVKFRIQSSGKIDPQVLKELNDELQQIENYI